MKTCSRQASCHTSNLTLFPNASSISLTRQLLAEGFVYADPKKQQHGKIIAEVYTHAAMVALWDLLKNDQVQKGKGRAAVERFRNLAA